MIIYPTTLFVVLPFIVLLFTILYFYVVPGPICEGNVVSQGEESNEEMDEEIDEDSDVNAIENQPSPEYKSTGLENDPVYLSKINAANIASLRDDIGKLSGMEQMINDLNSKVDDNTMEIQGLLIQNEIS
jgi:hypothetical protein